MSIVFFPNHNPLSNNQLTSISLISHLAPLSLLSYPLLLLPVDIFFLLSQYLPLCEYLRYTTLFIFFHELLLLALFLFSLALYFALYLAHYCCCLLSGCLASLIVFPQFELYCITFAVTEYCLFYCQKPHDLIVDIEISFAYLMFYSLFHFIQNRVLS